MVEQSWLLSQLLAKHSTAALSLFSQLQTNTQIESNGTVNPGQIKHAKVPRTCVSVANLQHSALAYNGHVRGGGDGKHIGANASASLQRMYGCTRQLQQEKR